ncbi:Peptidase M15A [Alkaliphilus metalliredigens QYMF]|uniref:Murein endopeptidase K n=1 Tax=Alkaliphilus metalliredigens (strain QYMF) TaxID=293826 RepID=A6TQ30_ALKMQ|nr:D-Ala-D-Ala carboxypeptidase family metallohydrolase [Alkaliphilus metalliredigens]ABR48298.1 Peptidase M15A [Alkaliphilus metalliredigens QYMF]
MNQIQIDKNFQLREFQCLGGSQLVKLDHRLIEKLQQLRDQVGSPVIVTSGFRTPEHNKRVGGSLNSQHLLGRAADIQVPGYSPEAIAQIADALGFTGVGIYATFTHVDVRTTGQSRWQG